MQTRNLGRTDIRLSEIALGTWGLAEESYGPTRKGRFDETVRSAIDNGVTTFDVAPLWGDGEAERRVGHWIAETDVEATIITRAGARREDGELRQNYDVESLVADCEGSLERLGVEAIDVWLLHSPGDETLEKTPYKDAVDQLIDAGKIKAWGVSVGDADEARLALKAGAHAICLPYSLLRFSALEDLATELAVEGCGVLARSPLLYGLLAGNWSRSKRFAENDHRGNRWSQDAFDERLRQVGELRFLVGRDHHDLASAALRFVLSHSSVTTALVGARTPYQIGAAIDAAEDGPPYISDDDSLRLAKLRDAWDAKK